jgi:hypothetical protein
MAKAISSGKKQPLFAKGAEHELSFSVPLSKRDVELLLHEIHMPIGEDELQPHLPVSRETFRDDLAEQRLREIVCDAEADPSCICCVKSREQTASASRPRWRRGGRKNVS